MRSCRPGGISSGGTDQNRITIRLSMGSSRHTSATVSI
jgi:hypothetical protein